MLPLLLKLALLSWFVDFQSYEFITLPFYFQEQPVYPLALLGCCKRKWKRLEVKLSLIDIY